MEAVLVGADHPLGHRLQARARDNTRALGQPHRAHGALAQAEVLHLLIGQQRKSGHHALDLQLVQLVIAGDEQAHEIALGVLARKGLHRGGLGNVQERGQLGDGVHAGRGDLLHGLHLVQRGAGQAGTGLGVGGIAAGTVHQLGLARFRQGHELGGHAAADLAAVGLHLAPLQTTAVADLLVGLAHGVVGFLHRFLRGVEAVGVLHNELAGAQKAEAGANLIAVLRLDLVQVHRQLLVGAQLVAHQVHDELLMGGPEAELVVVAVGQAHELRAVVVPAAALVP